MPVNNQETVMPYRGPRIRDTRNYLKGRVQMKDKPHGPLNKIDRELLNKVVECPFCGCKRTGKLGLKKHLEGKYCYVYEIIGTDSIWNNHEKKKKIKAR